MEYIVGDPTTGDEQGRFPFQFEAVRAAVHLNLDPSKVVFDRNRWVEARQDARVRAQADEAERKYEEGRFDLKENKKEHD